MLRFVAKSKIQRPRVTDKNLFYEGSITIDARLLKLADINPGELVQVVNLNNGARFETYTMAGKAGECTLNGGTARLGEIGDQLIIISYGILDSVEVLRHSIRKIRVDEHNRPLKQTPKKTRPTRRKSIPSA